MGVLEKVNVQSDLETLQFAEMQWMQLTSMMAEIANQSDEVTRLLQLSGFPVRELDLLHPSSPLTSHFIGARGVSPQTMPTSLTAAQVTCNYGVDGATFSAMPNKYPTDPASAAARRAVDDFRYSS
jgi:hypothetical protein